MALHGRQNPNGGFFNNLFRGSGTRANFRAARNLQERQPTVIAQSGDSRIVQYDDNSLSAIGARVAATRLYGPSAAASIGRRPVIEVQGPNGAWSPVNQPDPGAPLDTQIAALQAFRQTGQLGAPNQESFITSDNLPGASLGVNTDNSLLFGPPAGATGGNGDPNSGGATNPIVTTPQITENALPDLTSPAAPQLPSDPAATGQFGGQIGGQQPLGLVYVPIGDGGAGVTQGAAQGSGTDAGTSVQAGNAGNASGQGSAPNYQKALDQQLGANGAVIANAGSANSGSVQDAAFQDPAMQSYADAITSIESAFLGGRTQQYTALGPVMQSGSYAGDRAYGRYQVMGRNIPEWTKQALGVTMTPQQFLADPEAQDAVFADQFRRNIEKYGSPQDAASVWFTGRPANTDGSATATDGNLTGAQYVAQFNAALAGEAPTGTSGPPRGGPNPTQAPRATVVANNATDQTLGGAGSGGSPTTNQDNTIISNAHQFAPIQLLTTGARSGPVGGTNGGLPPVQLASLGSNVSQYKFF